jgi:SAM-dependent methyltransferase
MAQDFGDSCQKERFAAGEGDAWFQRNRKSLSSDQDKCPVLDMVLRINPYPSRVLEVGCANGWRLNKIMMCGARECVGIDPSQAAIDDGRRVFPALQLHIGTADRLPPDARGFNLIIFGFCLYLCDPADHFRIVAEADGALADGGHLVIYDFDPPTPYRNEYSHADGVYSYKMDYARLFLGHPHYFMRGRVTLAHGGAQQLLPDDRLAVSWLTKDMRAAWPSNP